MRRRSLRLPTARSRRLLCGFVICSDGPTGRVYWNGSGWVWTTQPTVPRETKVYPTRRKAEEGAILAVARFPDVMGTVAIKYKRHDGTLK